MWPKFVAGLLAAALVGGAAYKVYKKKQEEGQDWSTAFKAVGTDVKGGVLKGFEVIQDMFGRGKTYFLGDEEKKKKVESK